MKSIIVSQQELFFGSITDHKSICEIDLTELRDIIVYNHLHKNYKFKTNKEDIKVTEAKAIKRLRERFGGLGFKFEESFGPMDRIKIISPPDENGIVTEEWFEFDKGILGSEVGISTLFGTSTSEEANRLNNFIQTHYEKGETAGGIDASVYAETMKYINSTPISFKK